MKFKGKFRIIVTQEFDALNEEHAKQVGNEIAMKIYRENPDFDYAELGSIEKLT